MGLLADAFSYGDSLKRKVGGLLADPIGTIELGINRLKEDNNNTLNLFANAYPMAGDKTVLNTPKQKAAMQKQLADYAATVGLAGMTAPTKFVYPQDNALATAQRNAAKPVSEGGLGLRPDNTPMERAQAMGYSTPAYHGTSADFQSFNASGGTGKTHGSGAFFTENPSVASTYASPEGGRVMQAMLRTETPVRVATNGANWNWIGKSAKVDAPKITVADKEGDKLMAELFGDSAPAMINKKAVKKSVGKLFPDTFKYEDAVSTDDLARWANKEGYDSIIFDSVKDRGPSGVFANAESALPSKNTAIFNSANIRSRFAAFDPMRRNEADLLGRADPALLGILGGGSLLGLGAYKYGKE